MTWGELAVVATASASRETAAYLGGYKSGDLAQITDDMIAWQESGFSTDGMALPPVFAVVRLIASTIDQLDLGVTSGNTPPWLRSPRKYGGALDQGDLIQWLVSSMALRGAGYLQCRYNGNSWRLDALHPASVQLRASTEGVVEIHYHVDGTEMPVVPAGDPDPGPKGKYGRAYLLPVPYLITPQHPAGCSPITVARESINGYFAVERQASKLLNDGTHSGGRLESEQELTETTAKRYQSTWVMNRREGKIPVTGSGLRYVNDVINPKDAQWLESRAFNAQQIAAMFGMPNDYLGLSMIGGGSSLSYSNSQDNDRRYRRNCIEAFTSQIEDALTLLLRSDEQTAVFDFTRWEATKGAETDNGV